MYCAPYQLSCNKKRNLQILPGTYVYDRVNAWSILLVCNSLCLFFYFISILQSAVQIVLLFIKQFFENLISPYLHTHSRLLNLIILCHRASTPNFCFLLIGNLHYLLSILLWHVQIVVVVQPLTKKEVDGPHNCQYKAIKSHNRKRPQDYQWSCKVQTCNGYQFYLFTPSLHYRNKMHRSLVITNIRL